MWGFVPWVNTVVNTGPLRTHLEAARALMSVLSFKTVGFLSEPLSHSRVEN